MENKNIDPEVWGIYTDNNIEQSVSSAKTARLQRPKTLKIIKDAGLHEDSPVLLDIGCGSGNKYFKDELEGLGVGYNGCDPFNQTREDNLAAIEKCMDGQADIVTLNNVLNTIPEKEVWKGILQQAKNALNPETGMALILTYEGEKNSAERKQEKETGVKISQLMPIKTRDGFQNRMPTEDYLDVVKEIFPNAQVARVSGSKVIVAATNPSLDLDLKARANQVALSAKNGGDFMSKLKNSIPKQDSSRQKPVRSQNPESPRLM